jgi:NAD(P)-dependent dehydrogenase (short-subunit alcohol dehydrogenase family)
MKGFQDRIAVITGAASGFGLEVAKLAAQHRMRIVMADVQAEALESAVREVTALGADVLAFQVDVSKAAEVDALAEATSERFGTPHFVFNNAGVSSGGLIWEQTLRDWEWIVGVNLMGVVYGVRAFTPRMLAAAERDPSYEGHIINTASMAGLLCAPNMGAYTVTKHAVVALSETLYQDLSLVSDRVHASVLCPFFVPTGIHQSARARPDSLRDEQPLTRSQLVAKAMGEQAVTRGKVSAAEVAVMVFEAMRENKFYVYTHPKALGSVRTRLEDVIEARNPSDPFRERPELAAQLRAALRESR